MMATTTRGPVVTDLPLSQTVDLAARIQRRRDFGAHLTGFVVGACVLLGLSAGTGRDGAMVTTGLLTWATALSFQHFRHVLRGPVTVDDVTAEAGRLDHRA